MAILDLIRGPVTSLLIFGNSGFACMLVAVMQRPRLRQCTLHRLEWRTRLRKLLASTLMALVSLIFVRSSSTWAQCSTSDPDVDKRITSATAAFGALKNIFAGKYFSEEFKGDV